MQWTRGTKYKGRGSLSEFLGAPNIFVGTPNKTVKGQKCPSLFQHTNQRFFFINSYGSTICMSFFFLRIY